MNIHFILHETFEGPGCIENWAVENGHALSFTKIYDHSNSFPQLHAFDVLVIMGGSMSVYDHDKFPWINVEKEFIKSAVSNGKKVLGICLGSQLLASALGADVYPGCEKEIGWFPVKFTKAAKEYSWLPDDDRLTVFHWHGDTFDIPSGAQSIASSVITNNQGFIFDKNVIGLQFHFEVTKKSIEALILNAHKDFNNDTFVQTPMEIRQGYIENIQANNEAMYHLLNGLVYG